MPLNDAYKWQREPYRTGNFASDRTVIHCVGLRTPDVMKQPTNLYKMKININAFCLKTLS
jgi:hypothetical protein